MTTQPPPPRRYGFGRIDHHGRYPVYIGHTFAGHVYYYEGSWWAVEAYDRGHTSGHRTRAIAAEHLTPDIPDNPAPAPSSANTLEPVPNPDAPTPDEPDIDHAETFAVLFDDEPAVILLARHRVTLTTTATGALVAADALTSAVRDRGAQPMTDLAFDADPAAGWQAHLAGDMLRIITPDDQPLYDGTLAADPRWHRRAADNARTGQGLVIITGSAPATHDAALDMIAEGRASWIRIPLEIEP
ncbi:hypothetical protein [Nocardia tengchongensis]|uniref:hypothetical protein n=1 Tax=Nocardia tengchongensis TaxID=2055889 RepID=UPI00361CBBD5